MKKTAEWTLAKWTDVSVPDGNRREPDHRVSFLSKQEDFDAIMLARFGMTLQTIADYTGLTKGQITYRLKKAGVKNTTFRLGQGPYAAMVFGYLTKRAARSVVKDFRQRELDEG